MKSCRFGVKRCKDEALGIVVSGVGIEGRILGCGA